MKQINPLYLTLLLIVALVFVIVKLEQAKTVQFQLISETEKSERMAHRIRALKQGWDDADATRRALQRLVQSAPLRAQGVELKSERTLLHLSAKSLDAKALDYLLNKLLNGSYAIKKMQLKRMNAESASLDMEIAL